MNALPFFGWLHIARLGLIQACMGAVVVVTTSTLNRIMVVELALPALLPGFLVGFHYLVQMVRPRMGFGADQGRRCTPWMLGGISVLALGGFLASLATVWMAQELSQGIALAVFAFMLIGFGVSACGTSLLVLMSKRVADTRRAPAATAVWMMMIVGFAVTAITVGKLLDPYTPQRLLEISGGLSVLVVFISFVCLWNLEGRVTVAEASSAQSFNEVQPAQKLDFKKTLQTVWSEPQAKAFTVFVFLSMLAYSSQDLILEPFAGALFGLTPGETTQLSGLHHSAVLCGMLAVALAGSGRVAGRLGSIQSWMVGGCLVSGLGMLGLCLAAAYGPPWPLKANVFLLGVANGSFSIAAIATMMRLATQGGEQHAGTRMGLWGASQAIAFGLGGLLGTAASDLAHYVLGEQGTAYACVFGFETVMFVMAAACAVWVGRYDLKTVEQRHTNLVLATERT
ncbi:BCD family MFS transporter [Limnohabitans sp. B9-3]|uniref:BCD family MFS transporter n=1 Tax=Limnohabitans sp. B9-3 TaxID=1100707 RepID=UPI000C1EEB5B|nr:BCD family MFS transporter [Limnohabitans sp. B9-3]PIT73666.1 MFS transporter [Limnohabitans sp. B9-3]